MSTTQNEELDKFKRRLIRTVSRFKEQKVPDLWEVVEKAMGKDCRSMWEHMRTITLKKLARLIACGDIPERLAPVARMSLTDWLFLDMVLVHDQIDVIEMDRPADELRPLRDLFELVKAFDIEESPRELLAERWSAATLHYNNLGHQCSPMLLQKRWHQLKASTRAHFYHYLNYGRKVVKQGKNVKIRPCKLHVLIAQKYPDIITKKLLTWEEMMSQNLLALPHELEVNVKMQNSSSPSEANEPDLILMEPQVETIDVDDDSSEELPNENCLLPSSESDSVQTNKLIDPTDSAEINVICTKTQAQINKKHNSNSHSSDLAEVNISSDASAGNIPSSKTNVDEKDLLTSPAATELPRKDVSAIENSTEIPNHPVVPNDVHTKDFLEFEVPVKFESYGDKSLLTKQTVEPNVSPEGLTNFEILTSEHKARLTKNNLKKKNDNNFPKPKTQEINSLLKNEQCKPHLMETNDTDRSLIGKRLIIPPAVLRASKRTESLCSRLNTVSSKIDIPIKYPEISVSSVKTITDSLEELDTSRIENSVSEVIIESEHKCKGLNSISNKHLGCPAIVSDNCVLTRDSNARLTQAPKTEITIENKIQNESSKLNSMKIFNPPEDTLKTVNIDFDETEFIDGCAEAINIDEATLKSLEEQNNRIYITKKEESPAESEDDQLDKKTPNFDLKLLMQPIVYTTKIDDIEVLKNILSEQTVCLENIENFISSQTKPQVENSCKYFTEKLKNINLSVSNFADKGVNDERVLDDIIQLNSALANDYPVVKQETAIDVNQEITCLPTFRNEDRNHKVFDISDKMFKKPTYRTYTPIALCKHPDFNTRLKRLPVTFFVLPSNRQYLKTCKPLTIDLSKEFESKMVDGVMHVKSSFQANAKPIDTADIVQTVSLTPVTQIAETAFGNMSPDMMHSPEFTDTNNLLTQRKKPIELPDIEKVRAVNSHLKTAQVPPLQVIMKGTVDNTKVRPQKTFSADADVPFGGNVKLYCSNKGEVTFAAREKTLSMSASTTTYQPLKNRKSKANAPFFTRKNTKLEECFITCDTLGKIFAELGYPEMQTGQFQKKKVKQKTKTRTDNAEEYSAAPNFCCWIAQNASTGPSEKETLEHKFYCLEECTCCCKDKILSGPKIDLVQSEKEIEDAVAGISNLSKLKTPETPQVAVKVQHASPKTARKKITVINKNITQRSIKDVSVLNNTPFCANKTPKVCQITSEILSLDTDSQEKCKPLTEETEIQSGEDKNIEDCPHETEETMQEKTQIPVFSHISSAETQIEKNTELCITSDSQESKSKLIVEQDQILCQKSSKSPTPNESCFKNIDEADKANDGQQNEMCEESSHTMDPSEKIQTVTKTPVSEERLDHQTNNESCLKIMDEADNANDSKEDEKSIKIGHSMNTSKKIETLSDIIDLCDEDDSKIVDKRKKPRRTYKRKLKAQTTLEKQVQEWQAVKKQSRTAFGFSPNSPVKNFTPHPFNNVLDSNASNINSTNTNLNIVNAVMPDNLNADEQQQIMVTGKETFIIRHCKSRIPLSLGESRILLTTANLISPPATSFVAQKDSSIASSSNTKLAGQIIMDSNVCNVPQGTRIVILPTGQVTVVVEEGCEEITENQIKILQELIKITQSQVDNGLIEIPKVNEVETKLLDKPKSLLNVQSEDDNDLLEIPTENKDTTELLSKQQSLLKTHSSLNPSTIVIVDGDETNAQEIASLDCTKDEITLGPKILATTADSIPKHFEGYLQSTDQNTINRVQNKQVTSLRNLQTEDESSHNNSKNHEIIIRSLEQVPTNNSNETITPADQPVNDKTDKNVSMSETTYNDHNYATVSRETQVIENKTASLTENVTFEKPKNILSDLMEISGITNEDSTDVSEMQPEICMPKISNVSIVATYLTPITSVAELHQSNLQNGKFYVYSFKTGALANINVMHINQSSSHSDEVPMLEINPLHKIKVLRALPKVRNNQMNFKPIKSAGRPKHPRKEKIDTRIEILDSEDEPIIEEHLVSSDESDTDLPDEIKKKVERLLQRYKHFKSKARPKPFPIEFDNDSESDDEPLSVVAAKKNCPRKRRKFANSDIEPSDKTKKCKIELKSKISENIPAVIGHEEVSIIESGNRNVLMRSRISTAKEKVDINKQGLGKKFIDKFNSTDSPMEIDKEDENLNCSHSESDDCILGM